jgi:hypothetical protein
MRRRARRRARLPVLAGERRLRDGTLSFSGTTVPADHVHGSFLAALSGTYATVKLAGELAADDAIAPVEAPQRTGRSNMYRYRSATHRSTSVAIHCTRSFLIALSRAGNPLQCTGGFLRELLSCRHE